MVELFEIWYFVIGFLLGNGVPHFTFGAAGKVFRSPFGQRSSPRTNVLWGLSNFMLFGKGIKRFLNEGDQKLAAPPAP
jgi:hypothetical protein